MTVPKKGKPGGLKRKHPDNMLTASIAPPPVKQRMVVTPWRDTKEFSTVYDWLFAKQTTPANRRKALSHMRIWSLRRGNLCPASVLATGVLVQAQLEDKQGSANIQTTYASAFTRFFNFMSSIMQGFNMSSMYDTARQLGLQSFIVDLRHLCAHGQQLPPAEVLRHTAEHCLDWLCTFYWLPQRETMCNLDAPKLQRKDKTKFETEIRNLLQMFDIVLDCHVHEAHKLKAISKLKPSSEFNKIRVYCSEKQLKTVPELIDSIIHELAAVIKRNTTSMKDLLDIYMANVLKMKYFLTAGLSHSEEEEDKIIEVAQHIFCLLAKQGYIENIFVAFVQLTENLNADLESRRGASYWALKMVKTFTMLSRMKRMYKEELDLNPKLKPVDFSTLNKPGISKTMRSLLIHSGMDLSLTLVFGDSPKKSRSWVFEREFVLNMASRLNKHSAPILKSLLPFIEPPFSDRQLEDLIKLCDIKMHETEESENHSLESASSANEKEKKDQKDTYSKSEETDFGIWKLTEGCNWSTCALGVLPVNSK